ncbi:MAG: carbohydrate ABC transporter permease [bacterium]
MKIFPTMRSRETAEGYFFISPWILGLLFFTIGPIIASLTLSFHEYDIIAPPIFNGLENYKRLFFDDFRFWQALKVTTIYTVFAVPLQLTLGFAIAVLMNQKLKGITVFRTIYYLPAVVSGVAVAMLWKWIFSYEAGILNVLLWKVGIQGPNWLGSPEWVLPSLIIMSLWGVGGGMVIYLAGLQGIPTELYEAASIDGAGVWQRFWNVTIPMMTPVIFFNLVMGVIGSFQVFTQAYVMTQGGPLNASLFYVLYLYRRAFQDLQMGYASALAWILFIVILICTIIIFKTSARWVYYEAGLRGR